MAHDLDSRLRRRSSLAPKKSNLSAAELSGLKWLEKQTREEKISVVEADKGGAILIVYPDLLKRKTLEKLQDPSLYDQLPDDPTHKQHKKLFDLWVKGKTNGLISPYQAKEVMGISDNLKSDGSGPTNRPSTSPHFKPGISYFYPSLKIHKLRKEQLTPGVEPPIRLITALQDGITKRSDVFLAETYLRDLEKDFCADLLQDSTDALQWLENTNETLEKEEKQSLNCFTYDFKALYDSLDPSLVISSLREAARECRPHWSDEFVDWLVDLVELSLESSVGVFDNTWYKQKKGVPTGGSLCVQLANITVYSIMRTAVYSNEELMENVINAKRYIDDGAGFFKGNTEEFKNWITLVNNKLAPFGLLIDESTICETNQFIPFLDIQFCFDSEGQLQTDLYTKPTDSRSYLNFASAHPRHTFQGIVYSGCFRLRRIINDQDRLEKRLKELGECFKSAGYPVHLIEKVTKKALQSERCLKRKSEKSKEDEPATPSIRVVSTFGSDIDIVQTVKKFATSLSRTRSFSESDTSEISFTPAEPNASTPRHCLSVPDITRSTNSSRSASPSLRVPRTRSASANSNDSGFLTPAPPTKLTDTGKPKKSLFQFVNKTGPSIRNRVVRLKSLALGRQKGRTLPCGARNCKCCKMLSDKDCCTKDDTSVKFAGGNCSSYNVIYLFTCKICSKCYVGRSTRPLKTRVGEHRRSFYKLCGRKEVDLNSDEFALGNHLFSDHSLQNRSDFDNSYNVSLLDFSSPKILDVKEHKFIHLLNSLKPNGLNIENPLSVPLLHR